MGLTKLRFAALIAAIVLLVPSIAVAVSPFVDVPAGAFYQTAVDWALGNHITNGVDATHFDPEAPVSRGASVMFLKRYDDNVVQPGFTALGQTVGGLSCTNGQTAKFDGTNWACGNDADTTIPNTDTIAALGCTTDQVARFDGTNWVCNTIHITTHATPVTPVTVDSTGDVGRYTSIAIGTDGNPIISYYDDNNKHLKIAHCTNAGCTSSDIAVVDGDDGDDGDSTGDVGQYTSIAIGTDGNPIISYYDDNNKHLKIAHCTNAGCTSSDITVVDGDDGDSTGDVGQYTSIAIGTDGNPIISYYDDNTNKHLKVAQFGIAVTGIAFG